MLHPVSRFLVALIFLLSGVGKIFNFAGTASMMGSVGFPAPELFLVGAIVLELFGGLGLLLGYKTRWAALLLVVFLIPATIVFHASKIGLPEVGQQETIATLKNLAILGALVKFYLEGAGAWALDTIRARSAARVAVAN